jgi:hypothetical protein
LYLALHDLATKNAEAPAALPDPEPTVLAASGSKSKKQQKSN